jgi:hypothetical protein
MVKRAMMSGTDDNPVMEVQQGAGPFAMREKFVNPTGDIYLTRSERQSLGKQRAFTISMSSDT